MLPGNACSVSVSFAPTTASSAALRTGTLEIQTDATDSLEYISLIGGSTASPLTIGQASLNFGLVSVSSTATLSVSVTNNAASPVTFLGVSAGGAFSVTQGSCPAVGSTLAAGSSCVLAVTFAPAMIGAQSGMLSLSNDATQLPLTVALAGTGVASVVVPPTFVLTANGASSVTVTVASGLPATYALLVIAEWLCRERCADLCGGESGQICELFGTRASADAQWECCRDDGDDCYCERGGAAWKRRARGDIVAAVYASDGEKRLKSLFCCNAVLWHDCLRQRKWQFRWQ